MEQLQSILTRDELTTFLAIIGVTTMNGLEEEPLAGLEEREITERLNSGEQSLINRGLLELTGQGEAVLDDTLVALVGASAVPDATFLLSLVNPDGSNDPHYFNATPELLVEHHSPRIGIHQFDYLPDLPAVSARVQSLLAVLPSGVPPADGVDLQVDSAILASFVELAQDKALDAAHAVLVDAGISDLAVSTLLADYTTYPSWVSVAAWDLRSQEPQGGKTVMVIGSAGCGWLLENVARDSDMVRLRQANNVECSEALMRLLEPLKQTYQPSP